MRSRDAPSVALLLLLAVPACGAPGKESPMTFTLTSSAFAEGGEIPRRHTCDGEDLSPPLAWTDAPAGTKSFALVVDDPDAPDPAAPKVVWVHWVLVDLPPDSASLPAGVHARTLPPGTREGLNDWGAAGWRGPCPPVGRHRYVHKLYALDTTLAGLERPTKRALEAAMRGHVIGEAALTGTYRRR
jgi:hypothetical protein